MEYKGEGIRPTLSNDYTCFADGTPFEKESLKF